ncbi:hypothetical protein [Janthinobacterium sp. RB2R34]|uniref:hypothetical protein n=1 Tax=Janthinobacterium sp. RB2R34 TaxID=3424193 RepID=UPI003F26FBEA
MSSGAAAAFLTVRKTRNDNAYCARQAKSRTPMNAPQPLAMPRKKNIVHCSSEVPSEQNGSYVETLTCKNEKNFGLVQEIPYRIATFPLIAKT